MSVTIKEHLVGAGGNNVYETSGDMSNPMRVSNPSLNRAQLEARRVSTGPMALSKMNLNNLNSKLIVFRFHIPN